MNWADPPVNQVRMVKTQAENLPRFVVVRNGTVFQYCQTLKQAKRVVRIENLVSKILRTPVDMKILREDELFGSNK